MNDKTTEKLIKRIAVDYSTTEWLTDRTAFDDGVFDDKTVDVLERKVLRLQVL